MGILTKAFNMETRAYGRKVEQKREVKEGQIDNGGLVFAFQKALGLATEEEATISVSEETVMQIPASYSCMTLIKDSIAILDAHLYKRNDDGSAKRIMDERDRLLNIQPNEYMTAVDMKRMLVQDYILAGSAYIIPKKIGEKFESLYPVPSKDVSPEVFKEDYITTAKFTVQGSTTDFDPEDIMTFLKDTKDGFTSKGLLDTGEKVFKQALREMEYAENILSNGAIPSGILSFPNELSPKAFTNVQESWQKEYSGTKNAGKMAILEGGAKYQPLQSNPNEIQFNTARGTTMSDICRMYATPESMINGNLTKYSSNEGNALNYLSYCLAPIISCFESVYNKYMLTETEKADGNYFWSIDTTEITKTLEAEKIDTIVKAVKGKVLSINEGRGMLKRPALQRDYFVMGIGDVLYDRDADMLINSNTGQGIDPNRPLTAEELAILQGKLKQGEDVSDSQTVNDLTKKEDTNGTKKS